MARLEHVNITVADPDATAAMLCAVFGWHVRWSGEATQNGHSVHVGTDACYVALYAGPDGDPQEAAQTSYRQMGGLNHIALVVDDLDAVAARVRAQGYTPGEQEDYEPGRRFYFREDNGIEIEVVDYT